MPEEYNYQNQYTAMLTTKLRDLEEKQRILKDRTLLLGENLLDIKEKTNETLTEIKQEMTQIKGSLEELKRFIQVASQEFSTFAKKEDLHLLAKQAKMFQPLDFVRRGELETLKKRKVF